MRLSDSMKSKRLFGSIAFCVAIILLHIQTYGGYLTSVAQNSYLVKPGISVGNIAIGESRHKVRSLAGKPTSILEDEGIDQFSGFTVRYENDRVAEIIIISPRYRTAEGISIKSTPQQFLKTYPKSKIKCYVEEGATSVTNGRVYDEIDKGIAFDQQIFTRRRREITNMISVHRANVPAKIYGEIEACKK